MAKLGILEGKFPELRRKLDFCEFHEALAGNYVDVWLNLSSEFQAQVEEHKKLYEAYEAEKESLSPDDLAGRMEEMQQSTAEIYAHLWGCSPEEYRQLVTLDEGLSTWLITRTWDIINEYRRGRAAKALSG